MPKETIVIYGPFNFPFGDAGANRVYGIARAIVEAGWHVFVVGRGECREQDIQLDRTYLVDGIQYSSIYVQKEAKILKVIKLLSGGISYQTVWMQNGVIKPYAIISYANNFTGNYWVIRKASVSKTRFIVDVVEWYSPQEFKAGMLAFPYVDNQLGIRSFQTVKNSIVISKTLEDYFFNTVRNIIRIPPLVDTQTVSYRAKRFGRKIHLVYAGTPTNKDYLQTIIQGIGLLGKKERENIQFNIYGIDKKILQTYLDAMRYSINSVNFEGTIIAHGRVSRDIVLEALRASDFMVLLRPQMRYANAGFPSKVPESLAVGTPVMLNHTSDLSMYIRDGHEGIIVEECSANAMVAALRKALALSREELDIMRSEARKCAEEHFDYRNYVQPLKYFLEHAK